MGGGVAPFISFGYIRNVAVFSMYWDEILLLLRHEGLRSAVLFETRSCA